jgi:putative thioredoxin
MWLVAVAGPAATFVDADPLADVNDEAGLRIVVADDPANAEAIKKLASVLLDNNKPDEALEFLARIPETSDVRQLAARARAGGQIPDEDSLTGELTTLLDSVKADEAARQRYVDLLDLLGADHPRTVEFRRALSARLF